MTDTTRRRFLKTGSLLGLGALAGCGLKRPTDLETGADWTWHTEEWNVIERDDGVFPIVCQGGPNGQVLRRLTREVPVELDLGHVATRMANTMRRAGGVGIAGPQVGLGLRIATLMLDYKTDHPHVLFARNPVIIEQSDELKDGYEGCLSIPEKGGLVRRHVWVVVRYLAPDGTIRSEQVDGPNGVLWQHEIDHLEGMLYVDRRVGDLMSIDEMRRQREERDGPREVTPSQTTSSMMPAQRHPVRIKTASDLDFPIA